MDCAIDDVKELISLLATCYIASSCNEPGDARMHMAPVVLTYPTLAVLLSSV